MGLGSLKKWVWVLLFFSLALNIGFIVTAANWKFRPGFNPPPPGPMGPGPEGPGPVLEILSRMALEDGVREKVADALRQMDADHRKFVQQFFEEEEKVLAVIGQPGELDMETLSPLIEEFSQIRKQSALNKGGYIIKIRKLLGREKSLYLISEMKKAFRKRMHEDHTRG